MLAGPAPGPRIPIEGGPAIPRRSGRARWGFRTGRGLLFRGLAIALGALPMVACELVLSAFGLGAPDELVDPFVGFAESRPLFALDEASGRFEIPDAHAKFFRPESFGARKRPGEFRVFCLGGSTVQGRPFQVETSFTTWLELGLRAADPSTHWEVVNCGGVSYASYRLAPILREVLDRHEPDLIILYTGHNEFLEDRAYAGIKRIPAPVRRALGPLARSRTLGVLRGLAPGRSSAAPEDRRRLGPEVDAILDYEGGLAAYRRDDRRRDAIIGHFAFNVERMVRMCRRRGVPILLADPAVNLKTPPFKAEHRDDLGEDERRRVVALWGEARRRFDLLPAAVDRLERAAAIDDRHAGLLFTLGEARQQLGRLAPARAALIRAKDEDICPLRILEPMRVEILAIAGRYDVPVVDCQGLLADRCDGGITDYGALVDHVHPSIESHRAIAAAFLEAMIRLGVVRPIEGWEATRDRLYRAHSESLDPAYFLIGQRRLKALEGWAAGRGSRRRPARGRAGGTPQGGGARRSSAPR